MEEALKRFKNSKTVYFTPIVFFEGCITNPVGTSSSCCNCMPTEEFIKMIFDIVNNGILINVDCIKIYFDESDCIKTIPRLFMEKYAMYDCYYYNTYLITLEPILDTELYTYLKDDYKRYKLRHDTKVLKQEMKQFMETQSSFDDVNEFERILNALDK